MWVFALLLTCQWATGCVGANLSQGHVLPICLCLVGKVSDKNVALIMVGKVSDKNAALIMVERFQTKT